MAGARRRNHSCTCSGTGIGILVPWCGPGSTAKAHTEKLGSRSDTAPASDGPALFIGPVDNPKLAHIARQTASRGASTELNPTLEREPHVGTLPRGGCGSLPV